jgi:hypothetical protein
VRLNSFSATWGISENFSAHDGLRKFELYTALVRAHPGRSSERKGPSTVTLVEGPSLEVAVRIPCNHTKTSQVNCLAGFCSLADWLV